MEENIKNFFRNIYPIQTEKYISNYEKYILKYKNNKHNIYIWKGKNIIIDGYLTYQICKKNNINYNFIVLNFDNVIDAAIWKNKKLVENKNKIESQYITGTFYSRLSTINIKLDNYMRKIKNNGIKAYCNTSKKFSNHFNHYLKILNNKDKNFLIDNTFKKNIIKPSCFNWIIGRNKNNITKELFFENLQENIKKYKEYNKNKFKKFQQRKKELVKINKRKISNWENPLITTPEKEIYTIVISQLNRIKPESEFYKEIFESIIDYSNKKLKGIKND